MTMLPGKIYTLKNSPETMAAISEISLEIPCEIDMKIDFHGKISLIVRAHSKYFEVADKKLQKFCRR